MDETNEVTLKPEAIKAETKDETPQERMERLNVSDVPYHTFQTAKIAEENAKAVDHNKPYEYVANGYTVTEEDGVLAGQTTPGKVYKVTAEGFEKVFTDKRQAEIYVETHAEAHKDLPATISKA